MAGVNYGKTHKYRISFLMYCEDLNETSLAKLYVPFNLNPDEGMISIYQYFLNNNITSIDLLTAINCRVVHRERL